MSTHDRPTDASTVLIDTSIETGALLYDRRNDAAWVESTVYVELGKCR